MLKYFVIQNKNINFVIKKYFYFIFLIHKNKIMKITNENYKELIPENEQKLICMLLDDLNVINEMGNKELYIDIQKYHNEYSPERVDPCPDYYNFYTLRFANNENETVGDFMRIEDLDNALLILSNYICR